MAIDFDRVSLLLDVIHKSATGGPKLNVFAALASAELEDMASGAKDKLNAIIEARKPSTPEPEPQARPTVFPRETVNESPTRRV